jgi:hypothetical protein
MFNTNTELRTDIHEYDDLKEDFTAAVYGSLIWSSLYFIIKCSNLSWFMSSTKITPLQDLDLRNRIVSIVHGFGCILLTSFEFFRGNPVCGESNTSYQRGVIIWSVSYFAYDTIAMLYEGLLDKAMLIHHPLCIIGLGAPLIVGNQGNFVMFAIFLSELSNPAMHARHLIRLSGRQHTRSYEVAELTFILLYIYARFFAIAPVV